MIKFNYMLEIEIFRNSTLKKLGVLRVLLGVQKSTQTPCWLRPCSMAHDNFYYLFDISMIFYYRPLKNNRFILPLIVAGIFGEMDCFDILS